MGTNARSTSKILNSHVDVITLADIKTIVGGCDKLYRLAHSKGIYKFTSTRDFD